MYEERKDKFTLKDVIIQVLFVGVFIFLLMWLFPMKSSVKKSFAPLYDQVFNQNVEAMKEAAISYYTTSRLPQKIGDEKKMTLSKMLEENIILPFVDSKGNQCDLLESYVSMTKMNDEYILKVNLKCGEQEDYLLVHLGCYDYCEGDVCEKEPEKEPETPVVKPSKPTPKPEPTPSKPEPSKPEPSKPEPSKPEPTPEKQYKYEYVKVINGKWGEYSDWSGWTTNVINETDYRQVETKTETKTTNEKIEITVNEPIYENKRVQIGTETEEYTYTDTVEYCDSVPVYDDVLVGTEKVPHYTYETVDKYDTVYDTEEVCETKYNEVIVSSSIEWVCNDGCSWETVDQTELVPYQDCHDETVSKQVFVGTEPIEHVTYTDEPVYERQIVDYEEDCYDVEEEYTDYEEVPVYDYVKVQVGTKPVTKLVDNPVTTTITYYRSRTREYISGSMDTKWSASQNDQTLISQGYSLTGNSCEVGVNCKQ